VAGARVKRQGIKEEGGNKKKEGRENEKHKAAKRTDMEGPSCNRHKG